MSRAIQFKVKPARVRIDPGTIHLHWLWHKGPSALRGVVTAIALCGKLKLPRARVTSFPDDVTCPNCKAKVEHGEDLDEMAPHNAARRR